MPESAQLWISCLAKVASQDPSEQASALMMVAKNQAGLTLEKAMKNGTQISKLKRERETDLLKAMCGLITFVCQSLNVGKNMTELQVYSSACTLIETYWRLKLEEFILIFKNGCAGYYGKTYDRIDVEMLSGWIEQHLRSEDRISYFERVESEKRNQETIDIAADLQSSPEAEAIIQSMLKRFAPAARSIHKPEPTKTLEAWISGFREHIQVMSLSEVKQWEKEAQKSGNAEIISIVEQQLKQFIQPEQSEQEKAA